MVVQNNFTGIRPNMSTYRYKHYILFKGLSLNWMILRNTFSMYYLNSGLTQLFQEHLEILGDRFSPKLTRYFFKLYRKRMGLLSNMLVPSYMYHPIRVLVLKLDKYLTTRLTHLNKPLTFFNHSHIRYTDPFPILSFSIKNHFFNNLMFFLLHVLTINNIQFNSYKVYITHCFLFIPLQYKILNFSNAFYFKVWYY